MSQKYFSSLLGFLFFFLLGNSALASDEIALINGLKPLDEEFYVVLKNPQGKTIEFDEVTLADLGVSFSESNTYVWDNSTVEVKLLEALDLSTASSASFSWNGSELELLPETEGYHFDADAFMAMVIDVPEEGYYKVPATLEGIITAEELEPLADQLETLLLYGFKVNVSETEAYHFPMQMKDVVWAESVEGEWMLSLNDPYLNYVVTTLNQILVQNLAGDSIEFLDREAMWAALETTVELGETETEAIATSLIIGEGSPHLLGTSSSSLYTSSWNRIWNVGRGLELLNGTIVMPGESFSFLGEMGYFTPANGWVIGYSIINGVTVPDFGGGVCQVSTELYRALLKAGIFPDEQHEHAQYLAYYDGMPGIDATVYTGSVDLRFTNNFDTPIYIEAYLVNNTAVVNLYGDNGGLTTEFQGPYSQSNAPQEAWDHFGYLGYNTIVWKYRIYNSAGEIVRDEWLYAAYDNWVPQW